MTLPPCEYRYGNEVKQFLKDSLDTVQTIGDAVSLVSSNAHMSLTEMTEAILDRLPVEMGLKPLFALPPQSFFVNTVFWCLRTLRVS